MIKKIACLALLIAFASVVPVNAAVDVFTATLLGQLDTDVSTVVDEWGIGYLEDASVGFSIGQEAIIHMTFDEPIKFTGNWAGIATNIPVIGNADAESTGARILHFVVDGNDLGSREVSLINRYESGYMTIDIARQGDVSHDAYDLAGMEPFSTLEIVFIVENMPLGVEDAPYEPAAPEEPVAPAVEEVEQRAAVDDEPADTADDDSGFPGWAIGAIVGGVIVLGIIIVVCRPKKK
jgi:hypothetical protein